MWGGTLVYQAGYYPRKRTFKKHPKHVFFRYENRPYKYVFLHALFLICPPCPFQNLSIWPKTHPFPPILHVFCTPKRCTRIHCLVLKNSPKYIFSRMISNFKCKCPPRVTQIGSQNVLTLTVGLCNSIGTVAKPIY